LLTRPTRESAAAFAAMLTARGIPASVRYSRGTDIAAGCGQLRAEIAAATGTTEAA
jgi:23S rRNA (adenine2503-C2)-methyltransferase